MQTHTSPAVAEPSASGAEHRSRGGPFVIWLEDARKTDVARVGGKNASLGEMINGLQHRGIRVPGGFATTADAYRELVATHGIRPPLEAAIGTYRAGDATLQETGELIRRLFLDADLPDAVATAIKDAYRALSKRSGKKEVALAVRSSATAEDLADASFAGQQETFLNVVGERALLDACRRCYASLFTDRAISYREAKGFDHLEVALSIGVQLMVRSDLAGAGVMFSIDTETGFPDVAVISAAWGLGETVVQGSVDPDEYMVFKPLAMDGRCHPIVEKRLGEKARKLIYASGGSARTEIVETRASERAAFVLDDEEILELARWAIIIEEHYGQPMDMEWAKDGQTGELFIVQARPETVQSLRDTSTLKTYRLEQPAKPILTGAAVGEAIASGDVCLLRDPRDIAGFRDGAVLVAEMTDPDWVPVMRRAAGIITDHGGATSHAAIVSRELGVPAVVGTGVATRLLHDGQAVTLSCAEGDRGAVYEGALPFRIEEYNIGQLPEIRTDLMVNVASPAAAFRWWRLPSSGVGLARMEFIISNLIKIHPMALVHPEQVKDREARKQIEALTTGFTDGRAYFVETLARGIARIAAAYHPRPVIVRMSDFKTNEYAHLVGGAGFEPAEENPMLGFRGASRYYDERYREGFGLECRALKRVREHMGFKNIIAMVPFCRTPLEADKVLAEMSRHGFGRHDEGLEVYMMCEIPSNVILAEEFAARFDGFSIGSNDLTQLLLGVDRDSALLAPLFDERNEAVTRTIADVIKRAHACGIKVGICGQAPSDHPEFAEFLVAQGIDSISLNPDSFVSTLLHLAGAERGVAEAVKSD
jgi:pyruvate,water dikinase